MGGWISVCLREKEPVASFQCNAKELFMLLL